MDMYLYIATATTASTVYLAVKQMALHRRTKTLARYVEFLHMTLKDAKREYGELSDLESAINQPVQTPVTGIHGFNRLTRIQIWEHNLIHHYSLWRCNCRAAVAGGGDDTKRFIREARTLINTFRNTTLKDYFNH